MKPFPDDSSELDAPLTRALLRTDADASDPGLKVDPERTQDVDTMGAKSKGSAGHDGPEPSKPTAMGEALAGKIAPGMILNGVYQVIRRLGGGAMGDVWLVRHVTLKSEHALKVIIPNFATNEMALRRFRREFEVMASLHHPHSITIHNAYIGPEGGFIDMEYIQGPTIHDVLVAARKRAEPNSTHPLMSLDWITRILDQLTDVLQVAHEKGIVHRDLKPSNLMLLGDRPEGREFLKVLDFGIAKVRDDPENAVNNEPADGSPRTVGFVGTPSYSSPEQAFAREIDGRSDLYSVGIMLYEFLTGMLPFKGQYFQVITQHAQVPPPPFSEICPALQLPPGVEAVVRHCLEKLPDRRPRSAREVFDEFRAAVGVAGPVGFSYPPIVPRPLGGTITQPATTQIDSFGLQAPEGSASQPSTHAFTDPGDGFKPAPPSGLEPDDDDDFDPVPEPEPEAEPAGKISRARVIASALIAVGVLVAIGLVVLLRSGEPKKDTTGGGGSSRGPISDVADTKKPVETVRPPEGWKSLMPAGAFAVVKGYGDDKPWPDRLRREKDQVEFNRLADGIYIPEGYAAEEPVQKAEDGWPKVIIRGLDQSRYVRLVGGKDWVMGNAWDAQEDGRGDTPPHPVRLSGFYIQETEVTNGQFEEYLKTSNSARPVSWEKEFRALKDLGLTPGEFPAVGMSWDAAQKYAQSCSGALPTEAQWEFAARSGGQRRRYVWGDTPTPSSDIAGIDQPSSNVSPPRRFPRDKTEQGAFDLAGNVREWCRDAWAPYVELKEPAVDPYRLPDSQSTLFVIRGASFADPTGMCSTTYRGEKRGKGEVADDLGFRIVIECPEAPQRSQP